MEEKDVEVFLEDGGLTIRGEKKAEMEDKDRQFSERFYGRFERRIARLRCRGGPGERSLQKRRADRHRAQIGGSAEKHQADPDQRTDADALKRNAGAWLQTRRAVAASAADRLERLPFGVGEERLRRWRGGPALRARACARSDSGWLAGRRSLSLPLRIEAQEERAERFRRAPELLHQRGGEGVGVRFRLARIGAVHAAPARRRRARRRR